MKALLGHQTWQYLFYPGLFKGRKRRSQEYWTIEIAREKIDAHTKSTFVKLLM
jgi:hypothetical protein